MQERYIQKWDNHSILCFFKNKERGDIVGELTRNGQRQKFQKFSVKIMKKREDLALILMAIQQELTL